MSAPKRGDLTGDRWTDYAAAHARLHFPDGSTLEAGPISGTVNQGEFGDASGRAIHVITADNPGRDVSDELNDRAYARLIVRADELGWEYLPSHGGDAAWTHVEACLAVFGADLAEVLAVGREFGQDAIFEWTPSLWALVDCTTGARHESAWRSWVVVPTAAGPHAGRTAR